MAHNNRAFAIDDSLGTSDNLAAYAQLLGAMDAPLGIALSPYLALLAAGQPVDTSAIWNALLAAADPDSDPPSDGADGVRSST